MRNLIILAAFFLLFSNEIYLTSALSLIPGGENISFSIYPNGIIITGTYLINDYNPSRDSDILKGDRIIKIGCYEVTNLQSFIEKLPEFYKELTCPITIVRNDLEYKRTLNLIKNGDTYKTGLYVKERLIGVGTVSYYDPINNSYGALGHEIYDNDSESILEIREGQIYLESVDSITKSKNGDVGHKNCSLEMEENIGNIKKNTKFGIYGNINEIPSTFSPIEVAEIDEIKLGKATLLTCIKDNEVEEFSLTITNINHQEKPDVKGLTFNINDERLLSITGGVYSGMSGSPIIQNNKLIGAITHVNVDNVRQGYGIFMKYMYQMCF